MPALPCTLTNATERDGLSRVDEVDSTRSLCASIASGNPGAFSRFYRAWFDWCATEARRTTGRDESFCLDVVQDSMMRAVRSIPALGNEGELRAWLRAVVRSCAYDRLRGERRRTAREERAVASAPLGSIESSDRELDGRLIWLEHELRALPRDLAHLVHLRYRLGWTLARIGRTTGLSAGAVDGRVGRTIDTLQRRAKEEFHEP